MSSGSAIIQQKNQPLVSDEEEYEQIDQSNGKHLLNKYYLILIINY